MTLDEIRAEIEMRRDGWKDQVRQADEGLAYAEAELAGFDRAVAAMGLPDPTRIPTTRAARRDITALVRAEQERDFGQTIDQIAQRINARPSQVTAALDRIAKEPAP